MPELRPNDIILNTYQVERLLGAGAFGEVYLVRHLHLKTPRAVKLLRRDALGMGSTLFNQYHNRFELEARLGAELKHENLVTVHDFQPNGEGDWVLVMECAAGGDLKSRMDPGRPFSLEKALDMVRQVGSALALLHERQIVHRDIKPGNILFDKDGHAKLADLGLVQMPGGISGHSLLGSSIDGIMRHPGTPEYMSPEQAGSYEYLTPASDVYALGLVWFELLCGKNYKSLRPGTHLSRYREDTPGWVDELLARMLEKDPEQRPWDGTELLGEMEKWLAGRQSPADTARRETDPTKGEAQRAARLQAEEEARQKESEREAAEKKAEEERQRQAEVEAERNRLELEKRAEAERAVQREAERKSAEKKAKEESERQRQEKARREACMLGHAWEENGRRFVGLGEGVAMEFVRVPAGEFTMGSDKGSPDEKPVHKVMLDEYWMGRYPVTNAQYQRFVKMAQYKNPGGWRNGKIPAGEETHPVVQVSWNDAAAFCAWLDGELKKQGKTICLRLPNEAEWEKAARGTDGRIYPWGNQKSDQNLCNYGGIFRGGTTAVGKYSPQGDSPYGTADLAGNVWEWAADWYDGSYYTKSPGKNPTGPSSGQVRVLRGSSWFSSGSIVCSSNRNFNYPTVRNYYLGFRCAISSRNSPVS